ncbi:MAG: argininosuccinate lyase [Oscillospiraceae bacterium]|nr:argininosuccinate lyase [Oscillospiraceae bacterium]
MGKLWAGRFEKETDAVVDSFNSSIAFDSRLYREDIEGSIAHASMLGACGIIDEGEAAGIVAGLERLLEDIESGAVRFSDDAEDIHMNVETLLTERLGETGKRLHTARSRNDQVALDFRMYVMRRIPEVTGGALRLQSVIVNLAELHLDTVMPGYTHLQRAQPITLAHHLMAWCEMLRRDVTRLEDALARMGEMPLGAGALAGTTYPIDRDAVARKLGFSGVTSNSIDSVSDRDFAIETLSALSIMMTHLSRMAEEVILWCSCEFGFAELDDAYSTGSSIMPQKKNPDVAELVRGKTGRVYGALTALLTVMKGLPLAYNKDMQEDKQPVFDALDTVVMCLKVFAPMLATLTFRPGVMRAAASAGFLNATDAADYLVKKGMPFRDAYKLIGRLVGGCVKSGVTLEAAPLDELKQMSDMFGDDYYDAVSLDNCVSRRRVTGGPAREAVLEHIVKIKAFLGERE